MAKLHRDTYHVHAIRDCGVWDINPKHWTADQFKAVSARQAELRGGLQT